MQKKSYMAGAFIGGAILLFLFQNMGLLSNDVVAAETFSQIQNLTLNLDQNPTSPNLTKAALISEINLFISLR